MSNELKDKEAIREQKTEDVYSYQPRSRKNTSSDDKATKKQINKKLIIIPCAVIIALAASILVYTVTLPRDRIISNLYVNNVNVGGMSEQEAISALEELVLNDIVFTVKSNAHTTQFAGADIDFGINIEETAKAAMAVGKSSNIFVDAFDSVSLLFGDRVIGFIPQYNVEKLDTVLFDFGASFNGFSTEAQYLYSDDSMTIIPGTPGQNHDVSKARNEFLDAVCMGINNDIELTLEYAPPSLLNADEVYNEICRPSQDASYARADDGSIIVNEHHVGVEVSREELKKAIEQVNQNIETTLPADITIPEKTTEMLESKLFSSTIGTYTTDFSSSSANRAANVTLASNTINGVTLLPGEEFSYNDTIGNPSLANGYKIASVYENGKTAEGVGGGVCQVSSTLYSAVLYADLDVTERTNHSLTVAYVPKGQDATFAYNVIDFKFRNNTDYPVKINSSVNKRKLTVSIVGTKYEPSRKIEISHNLVSTIEPSENEQLDETLPAGTRKVVSTGKRGYVVDTYKTVYEDGVKKSSKKITRSTYKMVPSEVLVGNKAAETPPAEEMPNEEIPASTEISEPVQESPQPDGSIQEEIPEIERPKANEPENINTLE